MSRGNLRLKRVVRAGVKPDILNLSMSAKQPPSSASHASCWWQESGLDRPEFWQAWKLRRVPAETDWLVAENSGNVYLLVSGLAELSYINPEGKKVIIDHIRAWESVQDELFVQAGPYYIFNLKPCFWAVMPQAELDRWLADDGQLALWFAHSLWQIQTRLYRKVAALAGDTAYHRLIKLLLQLGDSEGEQNSRWLRLSVNYTHEQLAQMLGISRQTLTSLLACLESNCLIKRQLNQIRFEPQKLRQHLAES